ncbi:MAG: DUF445 family protein [Vampirovibrionia bacterium]
MNISLITALIVSPVLGAFIGYFTNWLAIKMLFRPYQKWHYNIPFTNKSVPVPFTPGLFPKEQERLAKKVAQTITNQLLTPKDLRKMTIKLITKENIELGVDKVVDSILKEFQNIGKLHDISKEIAQLTSSFMRQSAPGIIEDAANKSPLIKDLLGKAFDTVILELSIPKNTALSISDSFFNQLATPNVIRNWLLSVLTEENIIKVNKLVQDNTKGGYYILSRIITVKAILDNARDFLENDAETANETIHEIIIKVHLKDKVATSIANLKFNELPYSTVNLLRSYFIDMLTNYLINNSKQMADKITTDDMINILTEKILSFDTTKVNPRTLITIKKEISSFIGKYLDNELGNLIEQAIPALGIDNVIQDKVIKFSPQKLEALITNISKKELAGIQVIGGIIGFLIGCLSACINIII